MSNTDRILNEGETAPEAEALLCDGEVFEARTLDEIGGKRGTVLLFFGFVFSAPALNWWRRYEKHGWHELDGVRTVGVGRDGPYAQNEFLRNLDSPFEILADVDGELADGFGVLRGREGMPDASTARRSVFVLDTDGEVRFSWAADDDITPMPVEKIEDAVDEL
jgi:peroxiredoxin